MVGAALGLGLAAAAPGEGLAFAAGADVLAFGAAVGLAALDDGDEADEQATSPRTTDTIDRDHTRPRARREGQ